MDYLEEKLFVMTQQLQRETNLERKRKLKYEIKKTLKILNGNNSTEKL
jgi:hypothetical protein